MPQYDIYPYIIDVEFKAISTFLILVWMHSADRQKKWKIYFEGGMGKHTVIHTVLLLQF